MISSYERAAAYHACKHTPGGNREQRRGFARALGSRACAQAADEISGKRRGRPRSSAISSLIAGTQPPQQLPAPHIFATASSQ
jgi:hypothetical protein